MMRVCPATGFCGVVKCLQPAGPQLPLVDKRAVDAALVRSVGECRTNMSAVSDTLSNSMLSARPQAAIHGCSCHFAL